MAWLCRRPQKPNFLFPSSYKVVPQSVEGERGRATSPQRLLRQGQGPEGQGPEGQGEGLQGQGAPSTRQQIAGKKKVRLIFPVTLLEKASRLFYKVFHHPANRGLVDLYLGCSTILPICSAIFTDIRHYCRSNSCTSHSV